MILRSNDLAIRAGSLCGFFVAAVIGWELAADSQSASTKAPENAANTAQRPPRPARGSGPRDAAKQRVAAIRALGSPEARMRASIALANALPIAEIGAWLDGRWFCTGSGFDLTLFNKILKERWQQEDPDGLMLWSMKSYPDRAGGMLADWAEKQDPQHVLAFFKDHPNPALQLQALLQISKKNPALALQCLQDMPAGKRSDGGMNSYYGREVLNALAKSSPAALEAALASLPTGLQAQAESILSGQRLEASFSQELQQLIARPDGWKIFSDNLSTGKGLGGKLFAELENLPAAWKNSIASNPNHVVDSTNARQWWDADLEGMGFSARDAKRLRTAAVGAISGKQPAEALKLMNEADIDPSYRQNIISNIFNNLGGQPEKAESLLALLSSDEERQQARAMVAASSYPSSPQKVETPAEWLEMAKASGPNSTSSYGYLSTLRSWDPEKIAELAKQFAAMPAEGKQQAAIIIASDGSNSSSDRALVGDAIRYLVAEPVVPAEGSSRGSSGLIDRSASTFAVNWSKADPAAASSWVQSLPASDARSWAQKNLAVNWAQYDPAEARQWVDSLPADDRAAVQEFLKNGVKR